MRREPATATEFRWDPDRGEVDPAAFAGVSTVVNLGGVAVFGGVWTESRREAILSSRVNTTTTMARALAGLPPEHLYRGDKPTLIQAGGISWYGTESGDQPFTESSPPAADFLAQVSVLWEGAAQPAIDAGVRTVLLRTSPVFDRTGGAFVPLKLAWSLGAGAVIGTGLQHMPMVSLDDYLGVVQWAADVPHASGSYNLTIPTPTTNAEFTDELARQLHRPRFFKAPAAVLRTAMGELSGQLLGDVYVVPERLQADGYRFYYSDVKTTIRAALTRT